jgi:glycosyltransferase involved in cell wall biosynthesis
MPPARIPVVIFLTSFDAGGTERQMIELARRLDRERFEVHVACFHRRGAWRSRAEKGMASVEEYPISGFAHPGTLRQAVRFAAWCRRTRIAVVQACDLYTNIFALPSAAAAGVPVRLGSRRGLNPDRTPAHRAVQRAAYRFADAVVANSGAVARGMQQQGLRPERVVVIPNGLDVARFRPIARGGAVRRVGTLARLHPVKGLDVLVDALALLRRDVPHVEASIVGDGPERADLERRIAERGLSDRVRLAGHREDVAAALTEMDVFVLPSRSEAFPNALVEAMASALPVVATEVGGVPELIEHGRTGLLVPPGQPAPLAQALLGLVRQPERAWAMGRRARAEVVQRYSFDRMVARFEALYLEVAAAKHRAPVSAAQAAGAR